MQSVFAIVEREEQADVARIQRGDSADESSETIMEGNCGEGNEGFEAKSPSGGSIAQGDQSFLGVSRDPDGKPEQECCEWYNLVNGEECKLDAQSSET